MQLPQDFVEKYTQLLGKKEADAFFASCDEPAVKGFRLNPLKANYRNVAADCSKPTPYCADGFCGTVSGKTIDHQAGYVYSQDLSAMYVASVAKATPGEMVLDLCAAPGGKATQLAGQMQNDGVLVANEINPKRAKILAENMERIGAKNVIVTNASPQQLAAKWQHKFDKIIVDAPCSGEGMFRKDHAATKYWHKDYPSQCALRQKAILADAMKLLKPGGILLYSTCTFAPEEDEQVIAWLLDNYQLKLVPIKRYAGMQGGRSEWANGVHDLSGCVRLWFHHFNGEGHFIAKLQDTRQQDTAKPRKKPKKKAKRKRQEHGSLNVCSPEQNNLLTKFCQQAGVSFSGNLLVSGNFLYAQPQAAQALPLDGIKFLRAGLLVGEFKKKRFEPSLALALSLQPEEITAKINVTLAQWQKYVAGNPLPGFSQKPDGWYLLVCQGKAFAFGKLVSGTIKNFFPKGLRMQGEI